MDTDWEFIEALLNALQEVAEENQKLKLVNQELLEEAQSLEANIAKVLNATRKITMEIDYMNCPKCQEPMRKVLEAYQQQKILWKCRNPECEYEQHTDFAGNKITDKNKKRDL